MARDPEALTGRSTFRERDPEHAERIAAYLHSRRVYYDLAREAAALDRRMAEAKVQMEYDLARLRDA